VVSFDSTIITHIALACVVLINVVMIAMLYERFGKKKSIIIQQKDEKKEQ
jgi:hypothetical protein